MLVKVESEPSAGPAGETLAQPIVVQVQTATGEPRSDVLVSFAIERGGGTVEPAQATTDAAGRASVQWRLGVVPVPNQMSARVGDALIDFTTRAVIDEPFVATDFADVNAFLTAQGRVGSTEDLAFDNEGRLLFGVPQGIGALDPTGNATLLPLSGDAIVSPLGVALDQQGNTWVADSGALALKVISPEGVVRTVLTSDGTRPLKGPNYVGVDKRGFVYLSDPCIGELMRIDPVSGMVDDILTFDLPTEGGPNGFALDAAGDTLWLATENTSLLCQDASVGLTDAIAGLFAIELTDTGFGARQTVLANYGLFGDGVAVDIEGNVYAIFDQQANFALSESAIWVLPAGESEAIKFVAVPDYVLANLAFGVGDFGETTLYIARLAVPPFTLPETRGIERIEVGIPGLPVPPPRS
jgi:sugar lactone lactonase YvrE